MEIFTYLKSEVNLLTPRKLCLYAFSGSIHFVIIILLIISALSVPDVHFKNVLLFSVLIYAFIRLQKNAMDDSVRIIENDIITIRLRLVDQIRKLSLSSFESIDYNRFITILTQESQHICELGNLVPRLCSSIFLFCIAFIYVAIISFPAFLLSMLFILCGVQFYRINRAKHEKYLIEASHKEDDFFELLNQLLDGFKELKIHRGKNDDLYNNYLLKCSKEVEELKVYSSSQLSKSIIYANLFCYIFIAFLTFIFPEILDITQSQLIQVVAISLFITTGPIQEIVGSFPFIERANMAIKHLDMMEQQLQDCEFDPISETEELKLPLPLESLQLSDVSFHYKNGGAESNFGIGPIDFQINQGEIIFIMGGNGAGKSTLLKVLVGLYPHGAGNITWNNTEICQANRTSYQSNFAVIFQDMHLFDRLYGIKKVDLEKAGQLLATMKLEDKTEITEDGEITNIRLSAGQRKRLALIIAEFEDKEIYVFDEWAADQDPKFRKYFYEVYLGNLTRQGKTIIAITHDDHYYHVADHLLKMNYGELTKIR